MSLFMCCSTCSHQSSEATKVHDHTIILMSKINNIKISIQNNLKIVPFTLYMLLSQYKIFVAEKSFLNKSSITTDTRHVINYVMAIN